jgi:asparagine N-glycosylation enzyme membrane subunit Stt3
MKGMIYMLEFSIATISVFVGLLNEAVKNIAKNSFNADINKYIPICSLVFGLILGIAGYLMPNVDMGNNIIEAIFIGLSAGSAATGVHQIGKQMSNDS